VTISTNYIKQLTGKTLSARFSISLRSNTKLNICYYFHTAGVSVRVPGYQKLTA